MDITEVSLGEVTEQYLNYIEQVEEIMPDELADFLVVASRLLLIKARALLPQLMPEEVGQNDLTEQLRLYRMFVEVSKKINDMWLDTRVAYGRIEPFRIPENPIPPENLTTTNMQNVMRRLIHKLTPSKKLPRTYIDRTVSLKEKIEELRNFLKRNKRVSFSEMLGTGNRTEIIVSFLAILELVKQKTVELHQQELFSEITIESV